MVEKESKLGNTTLKHICCRTGLSLNFIKNIVEEHANNGQGKAEIFRLLISGFGNPKSHVSGSVEGEHKKGHTVLHRHR